MTQTDLRGSKLNDVPSLTLVIPAYNEAHRIQATINEALAYFASQNYDYEVIVVDDGSTDDTGTLAKEMAEIHGCLRVVSIEHGGKALAVRAGMRAATCDLIAFTDADLATPISYLETFRDYAQDGFDIVIGSREDQGSARIGEPAYRHVMGRVFNAMVRVLLLPGIQDTQCGFKLFTRDAAEIVLERSLLYENGSPPAGARVTAFDVEMLVIAKRAGLRTKSVPVAWTFGERSKVRPIADTLANLNDVATVKLNDLRRRYT